MVSVQATPNRAPFAERRQGGERARFRGLRPAATRASGLRDCEGTLRHGVSRASAPSGDQAGCRDGRWDCPEFMHRASFVGVITPVVKVAAIVGISLRYGSWSGRRLVLLTPVPAALC